jgi:L-rhamnose isomerase
MAATAAAACQRYLRNNVFKDLHLCFSFFRYIIARICAYIVPGAERSAAWGGKTAWTLA